MQEWTNYQCWCAIISYFMITMVYHMRVFFFFPITDSSRPFGGKKIRHKQNLSIRTVLPPAGNIYCTGLTFINFCSPTMLRPTLYLNTVFWHLDVTEHYREQMVSYYCCWGMYSIVSCLHWTDCGATVEFYSNNRPQLTLLIKTVHEQSVYYKRADI